MPSESVESLCHKARQAVAQGERNQAKQFYLQALGIKPDSPDVHHGLATVCFLLNDLPNAAYHFKEVTRLDPLRAGAFINLGAVYNRLDQIDEAITALRRGIQLDTHRAEGYYNLGLAYRRKKQVELAIQAYHEAVRLNPGMADAHYNLANCYLDKGQHSMAVAHYRHALELHPHWEKAEHGLAQAERALEAAKQGPPSSGVRLGGEQVQTVPNLEAASATIDPEKIVDPNVHGMLLALLHRSTIEADNTGRNFLKILEREIEPAIKELANCLLYPSSTITELDACMEKIDDALRNIRNAKQSLQTSIQHIRHIGERLIKE
jgi:tetratricopeptide (TPR) repeat protein